MKKQESRAIPAGCEMRSMKVEHAVDKADDSSAPSNVRLRKHGDYQRVYRAGRKQFSKQISYFFALRPLLGSDGTALRNADGRSPRIGLTVGKAMGKAVDRNRIKRRMREAVRRQLPLLQSPVDVVLHPRRSVIDLEFRVLEREVASVFRAIEKAAAKQPPSGQRTAP